MNNMKTLNFIPITGAHEILSMAFTEDAGVLREDICDRSIDGYVCIDKLYYTINCNGWSEFEKVHTPDKLGIILEKLRQNKDTGYILLTNDYIMYLYNDTVDVSILSCVDATFAEFDDDISALLSDVIVEEVFRKED